MILNNYEQDIKMFEDIEQPAADGLPFKTYGRRIPSQADCLRSKYILYQSFALFLVKLLHFS